MSGGGTGGHVYPLLSVLEVVRAMARRHQPVEVLYVGHARGMERDLVDRAGVPFEGIAGGQVRGQAPWRLVRNLAALAHGYLQARRVMARFQPQVCFVTGGWVTVPVVLAARTLQVPVLIYLPDVRPGLAIRALHPLAQRVAVTTEETVPYFGAKAMVTGYPVRGAILNTSRDSARQRLGLPSEATVVLVFGGSRGARSINRAVVAGITALLTEAHVVHITGSLDHPWVQDARAQLPGPLQARYRVFPYLHEEMPWALAAADVVVSRAGASVLGEFPARGLPAVLVPYPHAGGHQADNARYLARHGAAVVVEDRDVATRLIPTVLDLIQDVARREQMAMAARALYRGDARQRIAQELARLAGDL